MDHYNKDLQDNGITVIPCTFFEDIANYNGRKTIIIGEEFKCLRTNSDTLDYICQVLELEPCIWGKVRDKTNDIKLCEVHLGPRLT